MQETLEGIRHVRIFTQEEQERETYLQRTSEGLSHHFTSGINTVSLSAVCNVIAGYGSTVIYGLGGWFVLRETMTLGDLLALNTYVWMALHPALRLTSFAGQFAQIRVSLERIAEIIAQQPDVDPKPDAPSIQCHSGQVEFRNVSFSYDPQQPLFENLNLKAAGGTTVALTGHTGCGKTTLTALLMRMWDVQKGSILIDGTDIRNVNLRSLRRLFGLCAERIAAIQVVQTFGRERSEVGRFANGVHDGVRLAQRQALYQQGLAFSSATIHALTSATILWVGLNAVRTGSYGLTLGAVVAFVQLTQQVFQPIQSLTRMAGIMQAGFVALRRVFALLDEPRQVKTGKIKLTGMSGKITFENVTFRYPTQSTPALQNISFKIIPGEHVAVMGPSGAGKTTLFNLILRFYEPQEGRISVGGVNIMDADTESLRRHVRFVQQEPFLFSGSLADNISYGTPDASDKDILEVAELTEMHSFIMGLTDKYESLVAEQGNGLSGGQKQRLALAAALLTKPEILLMDDTTSALDARTEARIRATLSRVQQGRTSIIITQRITTARACDRIIVLEDGRITQSGTHAELSCSEGFYRRIMEQQEL